MKSRNWLTSALIRSTHSATRSRGFSTRSADLPPGSPIRPVAPPTMRDRPVPGLLQPAHGEQLHQVADVQPRRRRVEAAVKGDNPGVQRLAQIVQVSRHGDEAAPAQVVDDVAHRCIVPSSPARSVTGFGLLRSRITGPIEGNVESPASQNRHGRSAARLMPTRGPVLITAGPAAAPAAGRGPMPSGEPGRARVGAVQADRSMPSAWHSRAGPRARSRSRCLRRGPVRAPPAALACPPARPSARCELGSPDDLGRPQQDRLGPAGRLADQVHAEVHAVGEVDVQHGRAART